MQTGTPALLALTLGFSLFGTAAWAARRRVPRDAIERGAARSQRSRVGIAVQVAAFLIASLGAPRVTLAPASPTALAQAVVVLALWLSSVVLFVAATRAMGRNWSLVARTRADHQLVDWGPFAWARHPIYSAIALQLVACALALGHLPRLVVALPVYALGTALRVAEEERLLRAKFGGAYDRYAARVRRFVPGLF